MKNLQTISYTEMKNINGGDGGGWIWFADQIIDNWQNIKKGLIDGWNGNYNPPKN